MTLIATAEITQAIEQVTIQNTVLFFKTATLYCAL